MSVVSNQHRKARSTWSLFVSTRAGIGVTQDLSVQEERGRGPRGKGSMSGLGRPPIQRTLHTAVATCPWGTHRHRYGHWMEEYQLESTAAEVGDVRKLRHVLVAVAIEINRGGSHSHEQDCG